MYGNIGTDTFNEHYLFCGLILLYNAMSLLSLVIGSIGPEVCMADINITIPICLFKN